MKKKLLIVTIATMLVMTGCGQPAGSISAPPSAPPASAPAASSVSAPASEADVSSTVASSISVAAGDTIDVNGAYPVSTSYDDYQILDYHFAETDETVPMVISTNTDRTKYEVHFDFFGDEQKLVFSVADGTATVEEDMSGFIGKDVEAIYTAIKASDKWTPIA